MLGTKKGEIAIEQPTFTKIEADVQGGIARIAQRAAVIEAKLVMSYMINDVWLHPGDKVIIRADSGLQPWAKNLFVLGGLSFVLCPESAIIGYRKEGALS